MSPGPSAVAIGPMPPMPGIVEQDVDPAVAVDHLRDRVGDRLRDR